jgi:hypothetical protein
MSSIHISLEIHLSQTSRLSNFVADIAGKLGGSVIQSRSEQVNITGTSLQEHPDTREQHLQFKTEEFREELRYTVIENEGNTATACTASMLAILTAMCLLLMQ